MSAAMFSSTTPKSPDATVYSRIPVPSPTPLRRSGSLRIRDTRDAFISGSSSLQTPGANSGSVSLRRGHSFMERGERRANGVCTAVKTPHRPRDVTTEPRNAALTPEGRSPQSPGRNRSLSLSLTSARLGVPPRGSQQSSPRTPPATPDSRHRNHPEHWDAESASSGLSLASCDHASVAWNGTTFSGRSMKYVVHCNQHAGVTGEDYLTPTQRAHKQVKRLKTLLQQVQKDLEQKDSDIVKLTKEVVELRLYKAALSSPEDKSNSSDAVTVRENNTDEQITPDDVDASPVVNHLGDTSSYADSGHFDDYTSSSVHSKDSEEFSQSPYKLKSQVETSEKGCTAQIGASDFALEHHRLVAEYERKIQELVRTHEDECYQLKRKHNDKVEELLQRLAEINSRYWQLVPELEQARERVKELEGQLEEAGKKLEQEEERHRQAFLRLYEQEGAKSEQENKLELIPATPSRISVPELLHQLQATQTELENIKAMYRQLMEAKGSRNKIDPEITLQFLKSAIYYFLTDKENNQGHLRAIQSILGFTPAEISIIEKARLNQ